MAENLEVSVLLDYYGEMLTEKQRSFLSYYYDDDLSLSEIAENEGITRQGVRDAIQRAQTTLYEMEAKLGMLKKFEEIRTSLDEIISCADIISKENMETALSRTINDTTVKIKAIAQSLID